jgi:hypothetical protein
MITRTAKLIGGMTLAGFLFLAPPVRAQNQDRRDNRDQDTRDARDRGRAEMTRIQPGTLVAVRTNEIIDVDRRDNRVYNGIVDLDVRGDNGRLAIPRGSSVELIVRVSQDNDLILDLESVMVNGQRFAIKTDANRVESQRDNSLVGAIVGAINGGQARGQTVRIPRDSILKFRIERPLDMGVADRGIMREEHHYHDYYGDDKR